MESKGLICQMPEKDKSKEEKEWLFIPNNDERKRRCNGVCDCDSCVDEEACEFHREIQNTGFLVVRGSESGEDGIYELRRDLNDNPGFFKHLKNNLIIYKKGESWEIGRGSSPNDAATVWSAKGSDVPKSGWHRQTDQTRSLVDIMRVSKVPSTFSREMMENKDEDIDEAGGIVCTAENKQRLFIEVNGDDPYFCDKRQHCPKSGLDEKSCSIFGALTFEKPMLTNLGAVVVGVLVFMAFRKFSNGGAKRNQRIRRRKLQSFIKD